MAKKWRLIIVFIGVIWLSFNIFFLPFFPWPTGIVRAWLLLSGYLPYRDLTWLRTPLDLFLLGGWFKIFGISGSSYQTFIYAIVLLTGGAIYVIGNKLISNKGFISFLFYAFLLSPLFQSAEMGETLISFFAILLLGFVFLYLDRKNYLLLFISGIICGTILTTKQNAGMVLLAVGSVVVLDAYFKKSFKILFKGLLILTTGFSVPVLILVIYYFFQNGLEDLIYYTVTMIIGDYSRKVMPKGYTLGDGMLIEYAYVSLLVPFAMFYKKIGLSLQKIVFVILLAISLSFSLLPSFLSYRAVTIFPVISIVVMCNILIFQKLKKSYLAGKFIFIISFILFFIFISRFLNSYFLTIREEGFKFGNLIRDYGENEYKIARWIKANTAKDEKIVNWGSEMIYFLSDRYPKYKYIESFPPLLQPFKVTYDLFTKNPARIIVYDTSLSEQIDFGNWPFIDFMKKNYKQVGKYGDSLVIYQYNLGKY